MTTCYEGGLDWEASMWCNLVHQKSAFAEEKPDPFGWKGRGAELCAPRGVQKAECHPAVHQPRMQNWQLQPQPEPKPRLCRETLAPLTLKPFLSSNPPEQTLMQQTLPHSPRAGSTGQP